MRTKIFSIKWKITIGQIVLVAENKNITIGLSYSCLEAAKAIWKEAQAISYISVFSLLAKICDTMLIFLEFWQLEIRKGWQIIPLL